MAKPASLKLACSWERQARLDTILYNEIQALRGDIKQYHTPRDNALLEVIPVIRRALRRYERLKKVKL